MPLLEVKAGEKFYIIYPTAIDHEFEPAETVMNRVRALTGVRPVFVCDRDPAAVAAVPADAPAVLIGNNICPECKEVLAGLTYGQGEMKLVGRRVVIAAHVDKLLPAMVTDFTDGIKADGNGGFTVSFREYKVKDLNYMHRLPVMEGGKLIAYRGGTDECDMIVLEGTDEEKYRAYLDVLGARFQKEWERETRGNIFAVFTDDTVAVRAWYTPFNHFTRILVEPKAVMFVQGDESFVPVTTPQLTFMGRRFAYNTRYLGKDSGAGQMSYCIRLSDGSFLVYDGGLETDAFADGIWDAMRDQAPDPENIVIAAWVMTHSHIDHTGGFLKFSEKYYDRVKLERVFFNFPSIVDAEGFREAWNIRRVKETLNRRWPDTVYSKLHTGDFVKVRDAELEILFAHEDYVVQYLSMATSHIYNDCSLVARMTLGGEKVMFMADSQDYSNNIICAMYGDHLKSDMLQVCHHGGCGGTCELYALIDPDVAIFSTTEALLPEYLAVKYNNQLVYDQHVKQIFNSDENTITLPLPYTPGECNIPDFEGEVVEKLASSKGEVINVKKSAKDKAEQ